jgi:predicted Rossmann fold nucleotide-binding protein DprA/Smf involved in DNA uptake
LRRQVAERGAVVTAFTDDVTPARWTFPERNRWLAGMADALVVIEAPMESGALLTAAVASELNRKIYAFPGPAGSAVHAGVHMLLRTPDAILVDSATEVRELLVAGKAPAKEPWREALFRGEPLAEVARLKGTDELELVRELQRMEVRGEVVRLPARRYVEGKVGF